ncbi:hypothetical protein SPI_06918 [Niveomyces insectorum RCEF 264]|uniref:Uncharacterized protein n=1 Tax=Niveomyces insectorum RCEF 264 TaxID=1081102 RepID=A0A167QWK0_9HYPO|nr:hypothetical protein SPI_06918 [Niveomyces insectorum RCEF 264]
MSGSSQGELLSILRSRGISIEAGDIEAAINDPECGPALSEWAKVHLETDTLLSLDELELYTTLRNSGREDELAAAAAAESDSAQLAVPLSDVELQTAIGVLNRSTEAITKQAGMLRQQQEAVERLATTTGHGQRGDARAAFEARHRERWSVHRNGLHADVEQLSCALDDRLGELRQQNKDLANHVQKIVNDLCSSDDKLLASLQKLGWALPAAANGSPEDDRDQQQQQASIRRLRVTCLHLIKCSVETIRTKLDRLYLEAMEAAATTAPFAGRDANTGPAAEADVGNVAALQAELESLYAEILPVAQMSVEQQYLEPALKALSGRNRKSLARSLMALDYINECLDFLLEHISLLSRRIEAAAVHQAAADSLTAIAHSELATPVASLRKRETPQQQLNNHDSPVRRRPSLGGSPMRARSGTGGALKGHRRRSSGFSSGGFADAPPFDQLLQDLSLELPMLDSAELGREGGNGGVASAALVVHSRFLQSTLAERSAKADEVASNAQVSFEAAAATQLADARRAVWMARESVLAETPFGPVQLVDPEIDTSIAVMAQEVGRFRAALDDAGKNLARVQRGRSAKRDQFVARWG